MTRLETAVAEMAGKPPDPVPSTPSLDLPVPTPVSPQPIITPPAKKPRQPATIAQTPPQQTATLPEPTSAARLLDQPDESPPEKTWRDSLPENIWRGDFWFNKIGLGLLLLALAFLFNYAIDQGWIGPAVRVAFGLILGTALLGIGYRTAQKRPNFGQALQGGGIVAYYITGFAAFRLYSLVSFPVAFGFMLLVTVLAFTLSLRQQEAMFSLIGGFGGLATPFLLNTGQSNYVGLILYICLICGSLVLIYFFKGWRVLLWLANVSGWIILTGVMLFAGLDYSKSITAENATLQGGILFGLLFFWGMPVLRQLEFARRPDRLPPVQFGIFDSYLARTRLAVKEVPRLTMSMNPLIALGLTQTLWWISETSQGLIALGAALLFALVAVGIATKSSQDKLWYVHGFTAVLLFTITLLQLLDGNWLFLALALEAIALHVGTRHLKYISLEVVAHLLSLAVTIMLFDRLLFRFHPEQWTFNLSSFLDLLIIGLWFALVTFLQTKKKSFFQPVYWLIAHLALILWWQRELEPYNVPGLVTAIFGLLAIFFHWDARRQKHSWQRWVPHLLSLVVTVMLFDQLWFGRSETAVFNLLALFNLIIIGLLFASSYLFKEQGEMQVRLFYRLVCHAALLNWFWREFDQLSGQGIVTLVWGIYALILLAISLKYESYQLRLVALGTLFLLVGKLFLVDLATVETIWRILLFAGFGGLFLFLSYYYRSWLHLPEHAS
ncbi:MAG: DUF2339 domain-containing protein [Ardenticatenaceae bacterium]|nr:DUF2339 domain-containing protein [Ardenticatenaceae bacterium]